MVGYVVATLQQLVPRTLCALCIRIHRLIPFLVTTLVVQLEAANSP